MLKPSSSQYYPASAEEEFKEKKAGETNFKGPIRQSTTSLYLKEVGLGMSLSSIQAAKFLTTIIQKKERQKSEILNNFPTSCHSDEMWVGVTRYKPEMKAFLSAV